MNGHIVQATHISRIFPMAAGPVTAVADVSLQIAPGDHIDWMRLPLMVLTYAIAHALPLLRRGRRQCQLCSELPRASASGRESLIVQDDAALFRPEP